jgi:cystathionine beta-lyase
MSHQKMKFGTLAVHAGVEPDPGTGAIMTPIYQTSTYVQEGIGNHKGYEYSRTHNPTRTALQNSLAGLENGRHGITFASGLAAIDAVIKLLNPGDEVIAVNDLYGGTYRLFTTVFAKYGIKFTFTDLRDASTLSKLITANTKLVWIETPTNPVMQVVDIAAVAAHCRENSILLAVDNTFATPALQTPLDLGADIVMHSVTKYLGGHSDVIMGALVVNDEALAERLYTLQNSCGAVHGPMDAFLVLRGVKTLHLRMKAHCENGHAIAQWLKNHPAVDQVYYPGLPEHPNHEVAARQMRGFGGMVAFTMKNDALEVAQNIVAKFKLFALAESLGGVESLVGHPASMTHASIPKHEREKSGVTDSLIRLSVGIEDLDDLIADLENALA